MKIFTKHLIDEISVENAGVKIRGAFSLVEFNFNYFCQNKIDEFMQYVLINHSGVEKWVLEKNYPIANTHEILIIKRQKIQLSLIFQ